MDNAESSACYRSPRSRQKYRDRVQRRAIDPQFFTLKLRGTTRPLPTQARSVACRSVLASYTRSLTQSTPEVIYNSAYDCAHDLSPR